MEAITSVGIDVGTTTTNVAFSRLCIENTAGPFTVPQISVVDKRIIYQGAPFFTPLKNTVEIDVLPLISLIKEEYVQAGIEAETVEAGAVIITGESARKENAASLLEELSGLAGEFVVSAAGPDMESVIAGKGSGAYEYSKRNNCRVINIDVGGGTTNSVLFDNGKTVSTGCIDIGGRLIRTDDSGKVIAFSKAAEHIAEAIGLELFLGMNDESALLGICTCMAQMIAEQVHLAPQSELCKSLKSPHSANFDFEGVSDFICFSGGVADAIRGCFSASSNPYRFGDIGILLGRAIAEHPLFRTVSILSAGETIGATVIGAGSYATTVSGSTIDAAAKALPLRNVPVFVLGEAEQERLYQGDCSEFKKQLAYAVELNGELLAIALRGQVYPSYQQIKLLAECLGTTVDEQFKSSVPLITVCEHDMAKVLGGRLRAHTERPVIAIDGIPLEVQDQIDIGKPIGGGIVVPVVVKTLIFGT